MRGLVQRHPVAFMLLVTFGFSWACFFSGIFLVSEPQAVKLALFVLGGFGPAVGGILTLRLLPGERGGGIPALVPFSIGAGLAALAFACFRLDLFGVTGQTGVLDFPADSPAWAYAVVALPCLLSGYVFASVGARNRRVRAWFFGLVPDRQTLLLAIPVLLFIPMLMSGSNLLADALGWDYETPAHLRDSVSLWVPLMVVKLFTVFMLTGGNEEHGWRGVLQPLLQRRFSPLWAVLFIGVVWELWHLPIVIAGIYGEGPIWQVTLGRLLTTVCFAFLLSFIYNGTRGSIFLCVLFHACINAQISVFAGSWLALPLAWGVVLLGVLVTRAWRSDSGYHPTLH